MSVSRFQSGARVSAISRRMSVMAHWPVAGTVEGHIRAEQVRVVFHQAPPAQLLGIFAALVVASILWGVADRLYVSIWCGGVAVLTLARIGLAATFNRLDPTPEEMPFWEATFVASLAVVSLLWGVGPLLIMPYDSPLHEATVFCFLIGVAGGAVSVFSAHALASRISVTSILLPATVVFALQDTLELQVMSLGGALYLAAALRASRKMGFFLRRTFQLSYELTEAYSRARNQARTDELTGLANRRSFIDRAVSALDQSRRYERPVSIAMIDIDHFKSINDRFGHAAGDTALRTMALILRRVARAADTPGRLGGEEFAVLMPETSAQEAYVLAERLRAEIEKSVTVHDRVSFSFTCSIGIAEWRRETLSVDALLRAADEALYAAKEEGRNTVVVQ